VSLDFWVNKMINDMISTAQTMDIQRAIFLSTENEVLLQGNVHKGNLSYETDVVISHTQLNRIMSELQRNNENSNVNDCLDSKEVKPNEWLYFADFSALAQSQITLDSLVHYEEIKQIRA